MYYELVADDFFSVLIRQKHESINCVDRKVTGEMQELKIIELRPKQSEADSKQFDQVELGTIHLPLDLDLETNRTKIENHLRNRI